MTARNLGKEMGEDEEEGGGGGGRWERKAGEDP